MGQSWETPRSFALLLSTAASLLCSSFSARHQHPSISLSSPISSYHHQYIPSFVCRLRRPFPDLHPIHAISTRPSVYHAPQKTLDHPRCLLITSDLLHSENISTQPSSYTHWPPTFFCRLLCLLWILHLKASAPVHQSITIAINPYPLCRINCRIVT